MFVKDDIEYASGPADGICVMEVKVLPYAMLLLTFSTGEQRLFDLTTLQGDAFEPLKSAEVQQTVQVVHGYGIWLGGTIDCAPEYLYENSYAYHRDLVG